MISDIPYPKIKLNKVPLEKNWKSISGLTSYKNHLIGISDEFKKLYIKKLNLTQTTDITWSSDANQTEFETELTSDSLPSNYFERKKVKPDFESISRVENNFILMPSFSKSNRVLLGLVRMAEQNNFLSNEYCELNLTNLYELILKKFSLVFPNLNPEINIEGHFFDNQDLILISRGNFLSDNYLITIKNAFLSVETIQTDLLQKINISQLQITQIPKILDPVANENIQITEVKFQNHKLYFLGTIEKTQDSYSDGEILGSYIGVLNFKTLMLEKIYTLDPLIKAEGLEIINQNIYISSDPDSETRDSELFTYSDHFSKLIF